MELKSHEEATRTMGEEPGVGMRLLQFALALCQVRGSQSRREACSQGAYGPHRSHLATQVTVNW
jgi:hypothetical protein